MTILDGIDADVAAAVSDIFQATTHQYTGAMSMDGRGGQTRSKSTQTVQAIVMDYNNHARALAGIPSNERKVLVAGHGITPKPAPDDILVQGEEAWQVIEVSRDPASAVYTCRCRPVAMPDFGRAIVGAWSIGQILASGTIDRGQYAALSGVVQAILGSGNAEARIDAELSGWVGAILGSGDADLLAQGSLSGAVQTILGSGEGSTVSSNDLDGVVDAILGSGDAALLIQGGVGASIGAILGTGSAALTGDYALYGQVEPILSAAQLAVLVAGESAGAVSPILGSGDAISGNGVSGAPDLDPVLGSGDSIVRVQGDAASQVNAILGSGDADLRVLAQGAANIAAILGTGDGAVGGGGVGDFSDDFNRADENIEAGSDWQLRIGSAGDITVSSNKASVSADARATSTTLQTAGYVEMDWDGTTQTGVLALFARGTSGLEGLRAVRITNGRVQIRDNGSFLANSSNDVWPDNTAVTLRVEVTATQLRVLIDGSEVIGWTNYSSASGDEWGFGSNNAPGSPFTGDNFAMGPL